MDYDEYFLKTKELRIKYESLLLSELLVLNYQYYNCDKEKVDVRKIYNEMKNYIEFSDNEINSIIKTSLLHLENKYGIVL